MKVFYCIFCFLVLSCVVYSQENTIQDSININALNKKSPIKWNAYSNIGIGAFDKNLNHSASIGIGMDYLFSSNILLETSLMASYRNLFYNQDYRLKIFCPTCELVFTDQNIRSTGIVSIDLPLIFSYALSPNQKTRASFGVINSYNIIYYQRTDKLHFSDKIIFGKIPKFDLGLVFGASRDINRINIGVFIYHNINRLMKYNSKEEIENMKINEIKYSIDGLNPDFYKLLSIRIKYYLNSK